MSLRLFSEFGTLEMVLTHRPSREIERLTPYNQSELLFEDVPYLEVMQKEHDFFTELMRNTTNTRVLKIHDLLIDILLDDALKLDLFRKELKPKGLEEAAGDILARYSTSEIATLLIAGIKFKELKSKFRHKILEPFEDAEYLIAPCPNLYFMRDPAAVIQAGVICSRMKFSGRQRESNLLQSIFEHHPLFSEDFTKVFPLHESKDPPPSVEGGDVIILSEKALRLRESNML